MSKTEQIRKMIELNNGYLFTSEIETAGISRTYLAKFVKDNEMINILFICHGRSLTKG